MRYAHLCPSTAATVADAVVPSTHLRVGGGGGSGTGVGRRCEEHRLVVPGDGIEPDEK